MICNHDCFHCVLPDCVENSTPEYRARYHRYYVRHREKRIADAKQYQKAHYTTEKRHEQYLRQKEREHGQNHD